MTENISLFGCCSGERNHVIEEYQKILAKMLIEDREFYDEMRPALDVNADFPLSHNLKYIIGTLIDMRVRYGEDITYDALQLETTRKITNKWDVEEIEEFIRVLRDMSITEEKKRLCKEQFLYWKQFCILAKIGNATLDMVREPWSIGDGKLNRMIDEVKELAGRLEMVSSGSGCTRNNDW